ncbi:MAG: phage tail protein [Candidatus Hydrogenedentes bacterium]|nr:phage tail protein [Candidatus Hydrogenedentota bacterium]
MPGFRGILELCGIWLAKPQAAASTPSATTTAQHAKHGHAQTQHAESTPGEILTTAHPIQTYRIEVRDSAGLLVAGVAGWWDGEWSARVNEHASIQFQIQYSSTAWAWFVAGNQIWLRDDAGNLLERFHITGRRRAHTRDGVLAIMVTGASLIWKLGYETVTNYETGNETQTITVTATGGTFTLRFRGQTTGNIAYNASAAAVTMALELLSTIGSGDVSVTGADGGPWAVEFTGDLAETNVPLLLGNGANLTGGSHRVRTTTTRPTSTVANVVATLLNNFQESATPIHYGSVDAAIGAETCTLTVSDQKILQALEELRARHAGYMYVDPSNRRFYWKRHIGAFTGQYVRIGFNGIQMEEEEDFSALATRIIAYGAGATQETQISVTVNDATAQAAYGIIPDVITNKNITDATELQAWAQANLDARKAPRKTYRVGVIDLARLTSADYSFHDLAVGSQVRVVDASLGVTIDTTIGTITRNLDDPLDVAITVTNPDTGNEAGTMPAIARARDAADTIADMLRMILDEVRNAGAEGLRETILEMIQELFSEQALDSGLLQSVSDAVIDQLSGGSGGSLVSPGSGILSVGEANSDGTSDAYARVDHIHAAVFVDYEGD